MKKYIFILVFLLLVLFIACGSFKEITLTAIEKVQVIKMSQQGVEAEATVRINNPNQFAFTIYGSDVYVTLNGMKAGKSHLSENIRINANSNDAYIFKIKSDFSNFNFNDFPKLLSLSMSKNLTVELTGNLTVGKLFVKRSYPVDIKQNVPISK